MCIFTDFFLILILISISISINSSLKFSNFSSDFACVSVKFFPSLYWNDMAPNAKTSNYFTLYWKRCLVHLLSLLTYEHLGWYVALEIKRLIKVFLALCPMIHGRKIPGIIKKINKALGNIVYKYLVFRDWRIHQI